MTVWNITGTFDDASGKLDAQVVKEVVLPPHRPLMGTCGSCDGPPGVAKFKTFMGREPDQVTVWNWAQTEANMIYSIQHVNNTWSPKESYAPLRWTLFMLIDNAKFTQVLAGQFDPSYKRVAEGIKARDPAATIRLGHEMNGYWYHWSVGRAGTAQEYAAAYRKIVDVFRTVSPDFKFVFCPNAVWSGNPSTPPGGTNIIDWVPCYPGDAHVDVISYDQYEDRTWHSGTEQQRWDRWLNNNGRGLTFLADFAQKHNKPIAFDEWSSNIDDGFYITQMYNWMVIHKVQYQMYWHSNAAFPGSFDNNPVNGAKYKELFG